MAKFSLVFTSAVQFCVSGKLLRQFTHNAFPHPSAQFPFRRLPFWEVENALWKDFNMSEANWVARLSL